MHIDGETQVFAVLGHPVRHTRSPQMHNAAFAALGRNAVYVAFDVEPADLAGTLRTFARMGFGGVNITVPLKEAAFRAMDQLDESARVFGAVNTVRFDAGILTGFNTDGYGFLEACREAFGAGLRGRRVFILGAGGAGRAAALMSAAEGAAEVWLANRTAATAAALAAEIRARHPAVRVFTPPAGEWEAACRGADLAVNATPLGLKPGDAMMLGPAAFRAGQQALDLIYTQAETPFVRAARAGGAQAVNGLGMLLHQGVRALEIWTGGAAPVDAMRAALAAAKGA